MLEYKYSMSTAPLKMTDQFVMKLHVSFFKVKCYILSGLLLRRLFLVSLSFRKLSRVISLVLSVGVASNGFWKAEKQEFK